MTAGKDITVATGGSVSHSDKHGPSGNTAFRHYPGWEPRSLAFACFSMVSGAMYIDTKPHGSLSQQRTWVQYDQQTRHGLCLQPRSRCHPGPKWQTGHQHLPILNCLRFFSSVSFHSTWTILLHCLSYFSTVYLLIIMVPKGRPVYIFSQYELWGPSLACGYLLHIWAEWYHEGPSTDAFCQARYLKFVIFLFDAFLNNKIENLKREKMKFRTAKIAAS